MNATARCSTCGLELTQRNRALLFIVGFLMLASLAVAMRLPVLWIPATILALAGAYLLVWATLAKGMWCRQCKSMRIP